MFFFLSIASLSFKINLFDGDLLLFFFSSCRAAFAHRKSSFTVLMWSPWSSPFCRPQRFVGMQMDGFLTCLLNIWSGGDVWAGCKINFCLLSRGSSSAVSHSQLSLLDNFSDYLYSSKCSPSCYKIKKVSFQENFNWGDIWKCVCDQFHLKQLVIWSSVMSHWHNTLRVLLPIVSDSEIPVLSWPWHRSRPCLHIYLSNITLEGVL